MVGVESLRQRLSKILLEQIKRYLPNLMEDMLSHIEECKTKLLKLGDSHDTPEKQRQFLLRLSESFQVLCRAAIDGNYDHGFFSDTSTDDKDSKRLRAIVQNLAGIIVSLRMGMRKSVPSNLLLNQTSMAYG